jgi:MYXO-CTERM domain-containing protein
MKSIRPLVAASLLALVPAASAKEPPPAAGFGVGGVDVARVAAPVVDEAQLAAFRATIALTTRLPSDGQAQVLARAQGLNFLNVLWEDTGRSSGSSSGPNISDVTLQVKEPLGDGTHRMHLLPVLRAPNFTDKTADIAADKLWIKVGNQSQSTQLVSIPLSEMLAHLREYVTDPESIGGTGDLTAPRDSHYLVSAQHVFVPLPKEGKAEFNPVIFNYQSYAGHPALLTLLVTREGTSVAAITNSGEDVSLMGSGQQIFFNNKGQKSAFTAERKSAVKARIDAGKAEAGDAGALDEGADMMLLVQVPLKVARPARSSSGEGGGGFGGIFPAEAMSAPASMPPPPPADAMAKGRPQSDVEQAVIGHSKDLGPVAEGQKLKLERDPAFPVRVTVQFYKATSNGVVSAADIADAKAAIDKVYAKADFVGSLVVPEGARHRPTDWHLGKTVAAKPSTPEPPSTSTPSTPPPMPPAQPPASEAPSCASTSTTTSLVGVAALAGLALARRRRKV